jgi:2-amino-4-hydroxy-6-hydroxymethyldihydropteridine diphosphokinase
MIHLNLGSNLDSKYGSRLDNLSLAIYLLIDSKIKIKKISNFYETPSYPNPNFPKFLNIGLIIDYENNHFKLLQEIKLIERKLGRVKTKKNDPRIIDIDIIDFKNEIKKTKLLTLPHPKVSFKKFCFIPNFANRLKLASSNI